MLGDLKDDWWPEIDRAYHWNPLYRAILAEADAYERLFNKFVCAVELDYDPHFDDIKECPEKYYVEDLVRKLIEGGYIAEEDAKKIMEAIEEKRRSRSQTT